jgi:hypothetical protein
VDGYQGNPNDKGFAARNPLEALDLISKLTELMNFLNEFVLLLKARYPIIYIATTEEERIEYLIKYCAKKYLVRTYYSWDFVDGYQGNPNDKGFAARNPLEALDLIDKLTPDSASLFVLKDYDNFLKDFSVVRKLKNLTRNLKVQPKKHNNCFFRNKYSRFFKRVCNTT